MKDLALHHIAWPMGFPTAIRTPQARPRPRTRRETSPQPTRTDSPMEEITANHPDWHSDGKYPREPLGLGTQWEISQRTTRADSPMEDIPAHYPDRRLNGRYPSGPPGPTARRETSQRTTRTDSPTGNIPSSHPDRRLDGRHPRTPPGPTARCETSSALPGPTARWEISPRTTRVVSSMGDIPVRYLGRGFDGRYPSEPPGPRVDGKDPREAQIEGSLQDFPTGPGVGHSAAPTLPAEVGVFPSPGRRSPTGVSSGGQAANAQSTTTLSHRRLTTRRDSGCLR